MSAWKPNSLLRFLFTSMCDGIAVGWSLLLMILWTDIGNVGSMVDASSVGGMAVVMLAVVFAITFGSVGMGVAIFMQRGDGPPET